MKDETHEKIDDKVDEDDVYKLEKWVLVKKHNVSVRLKDNSNIYMI